MCIRDSQRGPERAVLPDRERDGHRQGIEDQIRQRLHNGGEGNRQAVR